MLKIEHTSSWEPVRATERHLPYGITVTQVNAPHLNPKQADWYFVYLPRGDERPWVAGYILKWSVCQQQSPSQVVTTALHR